VGGENGAEDDSGRGWNVIEEVVVGRHRRGLRMMLGRMQNDEGVQNDERVQMMKGCKINK